MISALNQTIADTNVNSTESSTGCVLETEVMVEKIIFSVIVLLCVFGNTFVMIKTRPSLSNQRSNFETLVFYLSLFDLVASVVPIMEIYEGLVCYRKWPLGWFGCKIIYPSFHISLNMSVTILILMSIDRCRSVIAPMKKRISKKIIHTMVFLSFVICILLNYYLFIATYINAKGQCFFDRHKISFAAPRLVAVLVRDVSSVSVFLYTALLIYRSLSRFSFYCSSTEIRRRYRTKKVMKMLMVMQLVYVVLVVPYDAFDCTMLISNMIPGRRIQITDAIRRLDTVLTILQMSNSFANCFVYAKMHRHLSIYIPRVLSKSFRVGVPNHTFQESKTSSPACSPIQKNSPNIFAIEE